jgi:hypothetical protein
LSHRLGFLGQCFDTTRRGDVTDGRARLAGGAPTAGPRIVARPPETELGCSTDWRNVRKGDRDGYDRLRKRREGRARLLVFWMQPGMSEFFDEVGDPAQSREVPPPSESPPDVQPIIAAAERHGMQMRPAAEV